MIYVNKLLHLSLFDLDDLPETFGVDTAFEIVNFFLEEFLNWER